MKISQSTQIWGLKFLAVETIGFSPICCSNRIWDETAHNVTISYHTIPCPTIPYHTIPHHIKHAIPYHDIPYTIGFSPICCSNRIWDETAHNVTTTSNMPYHTISYHTILCPSIPYHIIPYYTIHYHNISCHAIMYHTIMLSPHQTFHFIPYHTTSYYNVSTTSNIPASLLQGLSISIPFTSSYSKIILDSKIFFILIFFVFSCNFFPQDSFVF